MKRLLTLAMALAASSARWAADPPNAQQELHEVLTLTPNVTHGARVFATCVPCHGHDGNGQPQGKVPIIAQQHANVIAKQLIDYRHAERWDLQMEDVASTHRIGAARDIADVAAYVSSLPRTGTAGLGDGRNVELGARIYVRDCAGCHGADAEGAGALRVPRLAGQHYRYLLRQLHDTVEERRPNMPPPHPQLFEKLDVSEFTGIADYLARLHPPRRVLPPQ